MSRCTSPLQALVIIYAFRSSLAHHFSPGRQVQEQGQYAFSTSSSLLETYPTTVLLLADLPPPSLQSRSPDSTSSLEATSQVLSYKHYDNINYFYNVVWMADAEMTSKSIVAAEGLLFDTQIAVHLFLACIMSGILVAREIVRSREGSVAQLSCVRVNAFILVRSILCVP